MSLSIHNTTSYGPGILNDVVKSDIHVLLFHDILKLFNVVIHFLLDKSMSFYLIQFRSGEYYDFSC